MIESEDKPSEAILKAALNLWDDVKQQHALPVTGNSMLPLFCPGDQAIIRHGNANIRRGEIIVFQRNNQLTIHRVIHIHHDSQQGTVITTKGDNLTYFDAPVQFDQVIGRVQAVQRDGRTINLDTLGWRAVGRLIAIFTPGWRKIYGWCRLIKQKTFGNEPNRFTTFVRQSLFSVLSLVRKLLR